MPSALTVVAIMGMTLGLLVYTAPGGFTGHLLGHTGFEEGVPGGCLPRCDSIRGPSAPPSQLSSVGGQNGTIPTQSGPLPPVTSTNTTTPNNITSPTNVTSSGPGTIVIINAHWLLIYENGGPTSLGPTNQSLCSNCPISTTVNHEFTLAFQLTNHDTVTHTLYIGTSYVGCGVPFYLEQTNLPQPFAISAGQTVSLVLTIWPDSATPGTWTFQGTIQVS